jgi:hypothetical protein
VTVGRLVLTLATLAFGGGVGLLMLRGWRSRQRRQGDLPPPSAPPEVPGDVLVGAVPGLFVGTTAADDWLDRVAVHGLSSRAPGWVVVRTDGVVLEREGAVDLYLPFAAVRSASVGDALAGKVVGRGGLLLVDWQLGDRLLTSAFRADDHDQHRRLVTAIRSHLPVSEAS